MEKAKRFFKEQISCYGLTATQTKEVVKKFYPLVKNDLQLALKVGGIVLKSRVIEEEASL